MLSEQDRLNTIKFLEFEQECDNHNAFVIEYMNREHLNKTKSKQVDAAVKRWKKSSETLLKLFNPKSNNFIGYSSMAQERTWIISE